MEKILNMQDVKNKKKSSCDWEFIGERKDGSTYPLRVWENLNVLLLKHNIELKLNVINHDVISNIPDISKNGLLTDIYSMQIKESLNMSRDEVANCMNRVAEKNKFNPFVDMLKENKHSDVDLIREVFNCLKINDEYAENIDYYATLFVKWCINVVKMANNSLENDYSGQGVLVLQGDQGCFKSTFCRKLMPKKEWFKGDISLDTTSKDSIIQNTNYVLVEWGELDSTMKNEQAKLKQFITSTNDEYRASYARLAEKHPRRTTYIGTVNKVDFLKDETGSRRFWIIPILGCDIKTLEHINMEKFWGAVYDLWLSGNVEDYLLPEELKKLNSINKSYNFKNDVSIILEEKLDWNMPEDNWQVYNISEISESLTIKDKKAIKIELEKMGYFYKVFKLRTGKCKKGFRIPRIDNQYY